MPKLNKIMAGFYESQDKRFKVFKEPRELGWFFIDNAWDNAPCDKFDTLAEAKSSIEDILSRPNQGFP